MSNFTVSLPELSPSDLVKISLYAKVMGVQIIIDKDKRKYLAIKENTVGFIQKHKDHLFVAFKDGTMDNISSISNIGYAFEKYQIFPEDTFNFQGICKMVKDATTV